MNVQLTLLIKQLDAGVRKIIPLVECHQYKCSVTVDEMLMH